MKIEFPFSKQPFASGFVFLRVRWGILDTAKEKKFSIGLKPRLFQFYSPWQASKEFRLTLMGFMIHWRKW